MLIKEITCIMPVAVTAKESDIPANEAYELVSPTVTPPFAKTTWVANTAASPTIAAAILSNLQASHLSATLLQ